MVNKEFWFKFKVFQFTAIIIFLLFNLIFSEIISSENKSARNPIFSPDGKSLIYIERESNGPHMGGVQLVQRSIDSSQYVSNKIDI